MLTGFLRLCKPSQVQNQIAPSRDGSGSLYENVDHSATSGIDDVPAGRPGLIRIKPKSEAHTGILRSQKGVNLEDEIFLLALDVQLILPHRIEELAQTAVGQLSEAAHLEAAKACVYYRYEQSDHHCTTALSKILRGTLASLLKSRDGGLFYFSVIGNFLVEDDISAKEDRSLTPFKIEKQYAEYLSAFRSLSLLVTNYYENALYMRVAKQPGSKSSGIDDSNSLHGGNFFIFPWKALACVDILILAFTNSLQNSAATSNGTDFLLHWGTCSTSIGSTLLELCKQLKFIIVLRSAAAATAEGASIAYDFLLYIIAVRSCALLSTITPILGSYFNSSTTAVFSNSSNGSTGTKASAAAYTANTSSSCSSRTECLQLGITLLSNCAELLRSIAQVLTALKHTVGESSVYCLHPTLLYWQVCSSVQRLAQACCFSLSNAQAASTARSALLILSEPDSDVMPAASNSHMNKQQQQHIKKNHGAVTSLLSTAAGSSSGTVVSSVDVDNADVAHCIARLLGIASRAYHALQLSVPRAQDLFQELHRMSLYHYHSPAASQSSTFSRHVFSADKPLLKDFYASLHRAQVSTFTAAGGGKGGRRDTVHMHHVDTSPATATKLDSSSHITSIVHSNSNRSQYSNGGASAAGGGHSSQKVFPDMSFKLRVLLSGMHSWLEATRAQSYLHRTYVATEQHAITDFYNRAGHQTWIVTLMEQLQALLQQGRQLGTGQTFSTSSISGTNLVFLAPYMAQQLAGLLADSGAASSSSSSNSSGGSIREPVHSLDWVYWDLAKELNDFTEVLHGTLHALLHHRSSFSNKQPNGAGAVSHKTSAGGGGGGVLSARSLGRGGAIRPLYGSASANTLDTIPTHNGIGSKGSSKVNGKKVGIGGTFIPTMSMSAAANAAAANAAGGMNSGRSVASSVMNGGGGGGGYSVCSLPATPSTALNVLYTVGDNVDGLCTLSNGSKRWYPGTITAVHHPEGWSGSVTELTYTLSFNDGDVAEGKSPLEIRYTKRRGASRASVSESVASRGSARGSTSGLHLLAHFNKAVANAHAKNASAAGGAATRIGGNSGCTSPDGLTPSHSHTHGHGHGYSHLQQQQQQHNHHHHLDSARGSLGAASGIEEGSLNSSSVRSLLSSSVHAEAGSLVPNSTRGVASQSDSKPNKTRGRKDFNPLRSQSRDHTNDSNDANDDTHSIGNSTLGSEDNVIPIENGIIDIPDSPPRSPIRVHTSSQSSARGGSSCSPLGASADGGGAGGGSNSKHALVVNPSAPGAAALESIVLASGESPFVHLERHDSQFTANMSFISDSHSRKSSAQKRGAVAAAALSCKKGASELDLEHSQSKSHSLSHSRDHDGALHAQMVSPGKETPYFMLSPCSDAPENIFAAAAGRQMSFKSQHSFKSQVPPLPIGDKRGEADASDGGGDGADAAAAAASKGDRADMDFEIETPTSATTPILPVVVGENSPDPLSYAATSGQSPNGAADKSGRAPAGEEDGEPVMKKVATEDGITGATASQHAPSSTSSHFSRHQSKDSTHAHTDGGLSVHSVQTMGSDSSEEGHGSEEDCIFEIPSVFEGGHRSMPTHRSIGSGVSATGGNNGFGANGAAKGSSIVPPIQFDDLDMASALPHNASNMSLSGALLSENSNKFGGSALNSFREPGVPTSRSGRAMSQMTSHRSGQESVWMGVSDDNYNLTAAATAINHHPQQMQTLLQQHSAPAGMLLLNFEHITGGATPSIFGGPNYQHVAATGGVCYTVAGAEASTVGDAPSTGATRTLSWRHYGSMPSMGGSFNILTGAGLGAGAGLTVAAGSARGFNSNHYHHHNHSLNLSSARGGGGGEDSSRITEATVVQHNASILHRAPQPQGQPSDAMMHAQQAAQRPQQQQQHQQQQGQKQGQKQSLRKPPAVGQTHSNPALTTRSLSFSSLAASGGAGVGGAGRAVVADPATAHTLVHAYSIIAALLLQRCVTPVGAIDIDCCTVSNGVWGSSNHNTVALAAASVAGNGALGQHAQHGGDHSPISIHSQSLSDPRLNNFNARSGFSGINQSTNSLLSTARPGTGAAVFHGGGSDLEGINSNAMNSAVTAPSNNVNMLFVLREFIELSYTMLGDDFSDNLMAIASVQQNRAAVRLVKLLHNGYFGSCLQEHIKTSEKIGEGGFGSVHRVVCTAACQGFHKYRNCYFCYQAQLRILDPSIPQYEGYCQCWRIASLCSTCGGSSAKEGTAAGGNADEGAAAGADASTGGIMHSPAHTARTAVPALALEDASSLLDHDSGSGGFDRAFAVKRIPRERSAFDAPVLFDLFNEITALEMLAGNISICALEDYGVCGAEYWVVMENGGLNLQEWRMQLHAYSPTGSPAAHASQQQQQLDSTGGSAGDPLMDSGYHKFPNFDEIEPVTHLRKFDVAVCLSLFLDALYALSAVHEAGLAHFDLKCSNFILRENPSLALPRMNAFHKQGMPSGVLFLADFGEAVVVAQSAKAAAAAAAFPTSFALPQQQATQQPQQHQDIIFARPTPMLHSLSGGFLGGIDLGSHNVNTNKCRGTLTIQSPEMLCVTESAPAAEPAGTTGTAVHTAPVRQSSRRNFPSPNRSSDIWSMGCLLSEILAGEQLFANKSWPELFITLCMDKYRPVDLSEMRKVLTTATTEGGGDASGGENYVGSGVNRAAPSVMTSETLEAICQIATSALQQVPEKRATLSTLIDEVTLVLCRDFAAELAPRTSPAPADPTAEHAVDPVADTSSDAVGNATTMQQQYGRQQQVTAWNSMLKQRVSDKFKGLTTQGIEVPTGVVALSDAVSVHFRSEAVVRRVVESIRTGCSCTHSPSRAAATATAAECTSYASLLQGLGAVDDNIHRSSLAEYVEDLRTTRWAELLGNSPSISSNCCCSCPGSSGGGLHQSHPVAAPAREAEAETAGSQGLLIWVRIVPAPAFSRLELPLGMARAGVSASSVLETADAIDAVKTTSASGSNSGIDATAVTASDANATTSSPPPPPPTSSRVKSVEYSICLTDCHDSAAISRAIHDVRARCLAALEHNCGSSNNNSRGSRKSGRGANGPSRGRADQPVRAVIIVSIDDTIWEEPQLASRSAEAVTEADSDPVAAASNHIARNGAADAADVVINPCSAVTPMTESNGVFVCTRQAMTVAAATAGLLHSALLSFTESKSRPRQPQHHLKSSLSFSRLSTDASGAATTSPSFPSARQQGLVSIRNSGRAGAGVAGAGGAVRPRSRQGYSSESYEAMGALVARWRACAWFAAGCEEDVVQGIALLVEELDNAPGGTSTSTSMIRGSSGMIGCYKDVPAGVSHSGL